METFPIYIHLNPGLHTVMGCSHWFGYPDLPPDMGIPFVEEGGDVYPLTLVCQINLSDLPENDFFPNCGLLLFFADIADDGGVWDEPFIHMYSNDNKDCRVLYVPDYRMGTIVSKKFQYAAPQEISCIPITFDHIPPTFKEPRLQLLGTTCTCECKSWPESCYGWQLLLQMDSMAGVGYSFTFVDSRKLFFIINPDDLKDLNFSNVRALLLDT